MQRILLIEDNADLRENTAEILELAGYDVTSAPDGKAGIAQVHQQRPDLIICDIMMPVLDGYGVLHLLNKNEATASIPFIFLTAKTERGDIRRGMDMGADDYITKPFDKIELLNAIESRLRKAELMRREYTQNLEGLNSFVSDIAGKQVLQKLLDERRTRKYKKKENIYREGDHPRGLYYLQDGKVKVSRIHDFGKELILSVLTVGDFFGYSSLLEEKPYAENAEAIEDAEVVFIPRDEFFQLIYHQREVAKKFLQLLTKDVSDQGTKLIELAYSSVRKRVAEALLMLQQKYQTGTGEKASGMSINREDLANIAGTATESLIRTLGDFKDEKLIEIREGKILLINPQKLRELKN